MKELTLLILMFFGLIFAHLPANAMAGNASEISCQAEHPDGDYAECGFIPLREQVTATSELVPNEVCAFGDTGNKDSSCPITTPGISLQDALDMQLYDCIADERADWSVIGTADFVGESWTYYWFTTQDWDSEQGEWVKIKPIPHEIEVPGERLDVTFEDGSTFTYGQPLTESNAGIWADNLFSLAAYGMDNMPPPYIAVKWEDGTIVLLKAKADGTCGIGWYLKRAD